MELFDHLALGFSTALSLQNLAYAFLGCVLGTLIGVLPGLGPLATIAMLLPVTYSLPPVAALIMLAGIYYGAQYGGSTTAILVNLPGESSSVVTTIDGYQMARRGRAGVALATAGLGSFFAGCVATLILAAFATPGTGVQVRSRRVLLADGAGPDRRRGAGFGLAAEGRGDDRAGSADGPDRYRRELGRRALLVRRT